MNFITSLILSYIGEESLDSALKISREKKLKRKIVSKFKDDILEFCKKEDYKVTDLKPLIQDFVNDPTNKSLIIQCVDSLQENRDSLIEILAGRFTSFSKGTFSSTFDFIKCIEYAIKGSISFYTNPQKLAELFVSQFEEANKLTASGFQNIGNLIMKPSIEGKPYMLDCVPKYNGYFNYNDNCKKLNLLLAKHSKILITGAHGIGKTMLASYFINSNKDYNCVWVYCKGINELNEIVSIIFSVLNLDDQPSDDIHQNSTTINNLIDQCLEPIIVLDHLETTVDKDVIMMLTLFKCPVIVTSCADTLASYHPYDLRLPPVSVCKKIYTQHLKKDYWKNPYIANIVELAGHHPQYLELLSRANAALCCSPEVFFNRLQDDQENIVQSVEIPSDKDNKWDAAVIAEHIKNTFETTSQLDQDELNLLSILYILPTSPITQALVSYLFDKKEGETTVFHRLVNRGMVYQLFRGQTLSIELPSIVRILIDISDIFQDEMEEKTIIRLLDLLSHGANNYYEFGILQLQELIIICENMFVEIEREENKGAGTLFLLYKARLLESNASYKLSIAECKRILEIIEQKSDIIGIKAHVTFLLLNAYIGYGDKGNAKRVLDELNASTDDKEALTELKHSEDALNLIEHFGQDYSLLHQELIDSLNDNNDCIDKISIYQRLATISYYQHLNNHTDDDEYLNKAIKYGEEAIALIDKENLTSSEIASMVYTAYSAALDNANRISEAVMWGKKGLDIALNLFGDTNNHTITSLNNYGNALFDNCQYSEAILQYRKIISVYPSVFITENKTVVNAYVNVALSYLLSGDKLNGSRSIQLALDVYKEYPMVYKYIMEYFIAMAKRLVDKHDINHLEILINNIKPYVYSGIDFPEKNNVMILFSRLEFLAHIGTVLYPVKPSDLASSRNVKNFDVMASQVFEGMFDNQV